MRWPSSAGHTKRIVSAHHVSSPVGAVVRRRRRLIDHDILGRRQPFAAAVTESATLILFST